MSDLGNLPVHPTRRHPLTGEPVHAVWVRPDGRVMWPIMGGAPDDPPAGGNNGNGATGGSTTYNGGAGTPPPGSSQGAPGNQGNQGSGNQNGQAAGAGTSSNQGSTGNTDKGFPADTPVAEMTVAQQTAYWKDKAQRHEDRNKELLRITGGKYGDDLKQTLSDYEKLRDQNRTESERAVEAAKQQVRTEVAQELGRDAARAALELALGHNPETNDQSDLLDMLDMSKVLTEDGRVDTAKVRTLAQKYAPTGKDAGTQRHYDYGAGRRGGSQATGVAAGADMYAASRKKTSNS